MTARLADYVKYLLPLPTNPGDPPPNLERRKAFFDQPIAEMDAWAGTHGGPFTDEQKAIFFSMDRAYIVDWILQNETEDVSTYVMGYDFEDNDWDPGNKWENPCSAAPAAFAALSMAASSMGGWTAPLPQITRVEQEPGAHPKNKVPVLVVGEGIINQARLILSNPYESPYTGFQSKPLTVCSVQNFRRIYAKAELDLTQLPPGEYELRVVNPASQTPIVWRSRFEVKA
jgi:hypothetical protein